MGLGGFLWVPLSLAIGRRPVFLLTSSILAVATIWASFTTSFQQILAAVCLQGLAVSLKFSSVGFIPQSELT
jgi:MFS family permease